MKPDTNVAHLNTIYAMKRDEQALYLEAVRQELDANPIIHMEDRDTTFGQLDCEEPEAAARKILDGMTLAQKLNQMCADIPPKYYKVVFPRYNCAPYYAGEDRVLGIPAIRFADGPTGIVCGYHSTAFPVSIARGASFDPTLEERIGEAIGLEGRAVGANFFGGVCVNLLRHPAWGRAQETYGEDTYLLGRMGSALTRGVGRQMMTCVKHFAANSMENARFRVDVTMSERALRELYLPHFKACIDAGAAAVMSAYNRFRGQWCGHNRYLLRDILKNEWGFGGIVMSDFIWGIRDAEEAANGGMDVEMPVEQYYGRLLAQCVENKEVGIDTIDESVCRILTMKLRYASQSRPSVNKDVLGCAEHAALAREACEKSVVLLKNQDGILPLSKERTKKIAVVGRLAHEANIGDGKGSSAVFPPYVATLLDGIERFCADSAEVCYVTGDVLDEITAKCADADAVIVCVGLTCKDEGEYIFKEGSVGGDRKSLYLSDAETDIVVAAARANGNCIVCLEGGSAVIVEPWIDLVKGLLMCWYPGMEGGNAIADLIFGVKCPCAKLPLTIPRSPQQLPYFDADARQINYDYYHGYLLADKMRYDVRYSFGFGLSYARFCYSEAECTVVGDSVSVCVNVKNESNIEAEEIVQLYVKCAHSDVERHVKELKGFHKATVSAGKTVRVRFTLTRDDLLYYDEIGSEWRFEDTVYTAMIGSSSADKDLIQMNFIL